MSSTSTNPATLAAQIAALEAAIATGALFVKYEDKEVRYRSLDEMQRILDALRCQANPPQPGASNPGQINLIYTQYDKDV